MTTAAHTGRRAVSENQTTREDRLQTRETMLIGLMKTTGLRVLVCGGRDYDDLGAVWSQLDAFHALQGPIVAVIHGGARGADLLAAQWAIRNKVPHIEFKPAWGTYGPAAGPIRNKRMLDDGKPDVVIAFPGGRGTADMVRQATDASVEVVRPYG